MADNYQGRGAWSSKGGTLKKTTVKNKTVTVPGPYYMLATDPNQRIGLRVFLLRLAGQPLDLNEMAVYHGVFAIQMLLAAHLNDPKVPNHGVFDELTSEYVKKAQIKLGLKSDGVVGPTVMKALVTPVVKIISAQQAVRWQLVWGVLANEGGFDPGAVGYSDSGDLGLAQINMPSHPEITPSNAFCTSFAVNYVATTLKSRLETFDGNERDAVASYNLGVGGTREWIKAGRPDVWTPSWATKPRDTKAYIDRIIHSADGVV